MPARLNPHDNGLRRSLRLREQRQNEDYQKRKSHTTFGTSANTKVALGLFLLLAPATNIKIPENRTNPNSTFTEQAMNWLHEINKLYDGALNEVHQLFYATDISSNEISTFRNAMKQDDKIALVDAM